MKKSGGTMAIVVFWSVSVLLILSFSVTRRKIQLFEGIIIWCLLIQIQNNFMGMVAINFKLINLSKNMGNFLAYDSIRSVIVPLLMILFLEKNSSVSGKWKKFACWIGIILILVGLEYFAELLEVLTHSEQWRLWWTFSFDTALVSITFMTYKLIRLIARREVIIN